MESQPQNPEYKINPENFTHAFNASMCPISSDSTDYPVGKGIET